MDLFCTLLYSMFILYQNMIEKDGNKIDILFALFDSTCTSCSSLEDLYNEDLVCWAFA